MSVGFIQIGQCGNQLGQSFYQFMMNECKNAAPASQGLVNSTFFYQRKENSIPTAKAILVDMEPKVVNRCLQQNHNFQYNPQLSFTKQEGSGNNWAYGYNVHGPKTQDDILIRVNRLLEETDYMQGFFLLSSLAGGTGSGVGSYIQEVISDNYPELNLINICVLPHLTGEVILQSLNATLTIAHLYKHGQGIILLSNDAAAQSCNSLLGIKSPSLAQINQVMSTGLASFFWPAIQGSISSTLQNQIDYFDQPLLNLLSDTRYKILELSHVPQMPPNQKAFTNDTWASLEKRIIQMTLTGRMEFNIDWSQKGIRGNRGAILIARGHDVGKYNFDIADKSDFSMIKDIHQFNGNEKSICSLHNSQTVAEPLGVLVERATQMFQENAYIYQYEKYGIEKDHFLETLGVTEQILHNYQQMK